mmetsp:Transcript_10254/g.32350  ORF Transcript_10254/g.32350 Transcript_10254/m.32350 type:complete len:206 (-) Transcript_10254:7-624(-)
MCVGARGLYEAQSTPLMRPGHMKLKRRAERRTLTPSTSTVLVQSARHAPVERAARAARHLAAPLGLAREPLAAPRLEALRRREPRRAARAERRLERVTLKALAPADGDALRAALGFVFGGLALLRGEGELRRRLPERERLCEVAEVQVLEPEDELGRFGMRRVRAEEGLERAAGQLVQLAVGGDEALEAVLECDFGLKNAPALVR